MTSPNFDPLYSTDNIWLKADEDTCLSDHLDDMASDIASKAPTSHTHSGYATADHTHTGYATSDHTHTGYAESTHTHTPASIGAAPESHSHEYAASTHSHSYNDLTDKPTIPTIPTSLPANGGNADTVDGKHATDFAAASHTHSYAASSHSHNAATTSAAGFMSASDKSKLDGIATGANKTTVDSALSSSSTNPVQNKVINAALAGKAASDHTHEAQAITVHLAATYYSAPAGDTYTTVPLTSSVVTGSALTVSNNQIRIGAGISKVMVSAQICVGSSNISDNKFIAIRRTRGSQVTQLSRAQMLLYTNTTPQTMAVPGLLVDVAEGDLLTLDYYGKKDDTLYGDCLLTFLTVQKLA